MGINIKANLTSYETVWATDRNLPNRAYFLLEAHPENNTGYTFILNIMYINKTDINPSIGEIKYCSALDKLGKTNSLENNLIASLKGCIRPIILTLLGPLRICLYPKILRSNNVTNATLIKIRTIKIK